MSAPARAPLHKRTKAIKAQKPNLRDEVAKELRKPKTDFISETERQAAQDAQLDRTLVYVSAEAYTDFLARLDAPPAPNERLKKTMQTKAPWE